VGLDERVNALDIGVDRTIVSPIESAEQALELLGMAGACQRFLPVDQIAFDQLGSATPPA
jgi:hypothetical protein